MSQQEPTIKLNDLMAKFYNIGKRDYRGKVYDNVMSIFDELSLEEQKHFLRGCLGLYIAASSSVIHDQELIDIGNIDDMLREIRYAKRAREPSMEQDTVKDVKKPEPTSEAGQLTVFKAGAIAIFFVVLMHLLLIASTDDPDAIQTAKVYKNMFDIIQVFAK
jgi:hypothetical protein